VAGYKIRRALGVPARTISEVAARQWTLAPGSVEPAVRPTIPDSHLGRILGGPNGPRSQIHEELNATTLEHVPTRAFLLKESMLVDWAVYSGMGKVDLYRGPGLWPSLLREKTGTFEEAVWGSSYAGTRWFGHFLHDDLPLQELARDIGPMLGHARPLFRHEPGWRAAVGVPSPRSFGVARVKNLTWIEDIGQNPCKRRRFALLRSRLESLPRRGRDRILLLRGRQDGEERRVLNEEEVFGRLLREGFHPVDASSASVEDILEQCLGSSIVVSVEGSHAVPALYLVRGGGNVFFLYPPGRVSLHMPRLAQCFGLRAAMFIGESVEGAPGVFRVDPEELLRFVEQGVAAS
jgi:hypothetical protein